ncbi:MAG: exodeoxyribonuclease VII large subunit, partial [Chloroflexota bacterium]
PLENGQQYVVRGAISVYEANGVYQLYVADHRRIGAGELYQQFEALKARLEAEGLFAAERKRPLPRWPRRIGVATSAHGAVLHDLRQVIGRRFPLAELVLAPCQVQGAEAVRTVVASLRTLNDAGVDVIVIARGGGSIEDLWAFNHEAVARAIASSHAAVVSAVGHETDFTIADFVADVRAPTPSAAGELMVPEAAALAAQLDDFSRRAEGAIKAQLWVVQLDLSEREGRLRRAFAGRLEGAERRLGTLEGRLRTLSPLNVLSRGYAMVRDAATHTVVRSAGQVAPGRQVQVILADGQLTATVTAVRR